MKVSRLIPVAVAVVAAGGAGLVAMNLVNQPQVVVDQGAVAVQPERPTVGILVASDDFDMGNRVNDTNVRWEEWPEETVNANPDFVRIDENPGALETYIDYIALSNVISGEPVTSKKFASAENGFMSALLPPGKRAMATEISLTTGAGGFILPNDHVDVLMTRNLESTGGANEASATEVLFENVRVLAIGQTIREEDGSPVVEGSTATLELTPRQTQLLTAARAYEGTLTLALRSLSDKQGDSTTLERELAGSVNMILGGVKGVAVTE
ncbi:MAG: Flp pilus assembly protein CpaB [Pseudomonadota bacterium]